MGIFKLWLENRLQQENVKKLKEIWDNTLKILAGQVSEEDALTTPLNQITYKGHDGKDTPHKGPTAVLKHLNSANLFQQLSAVGPDLKQTAEEAQSWLNKMKGDGKASGASISDLMRHMFGDEHFDSLTSDETPSIAAKAEVEPQPPKPDNAAQAQDSPQQPGQEEVPPEGGPNQPPPAMNTPDAAAGQPPATAQLQQPQGTGAPPGMGMMPLAASVRYPKPPMSAGISGFF